MSSSKERSREYANLLRHKSRALSGRLELKVLTVVDLSRGMPL